MSNYFAIVIGTLKNDPFLSDMENMQSARIGENESERLAALLAYDVLDSEPEQAYDDLTRIASQICGTPIALVSLVDQERQWFKSKVGLEAQETPREVAFCSHAILEPNETFVIQDALEDERFFDNPLVTGEPVVRFYAGAPLVNSQGQAVGTLCVIDHEPRELAEEQIASLEALARQVVSQLELRKNNLELRRAATGLKSANEELENFAAFAAHDLRDPLNRIFAFSRFLQDHEGDQLSPESTHDLAHIVESAEAIDQLLTSMLNLCGAGRGEIHDSSIALSECAHAAIDSLGAMCKETNAQICTDTMPFVRGDMTLLTQVFRNLLENALKYQGEETPQILIGCTGRGEDLRIVVEDNGLGMDLAQAKRAFAPFHRSHGESQIAGSGLGLAIVKKIVERHGGAISVVSQPGQGSRFEFSLSGMRLPRSPQQVSPTDTDQEGFEFELEELYG